MWADVDTGVCLLIIIYLASFSIQVPQNRLKQNNDTVTTVVRRYGLNPALALASVTAVPAKAAGMDHRVGTIAEGLLFSSY